MANKRDDENIHFPGKSFLFPIISSSSYEKSDFVQTRSLLPSVSIHENREKESLDWLSNSSYNIPAEVTSDFQVEDENESTSSLSSNEEPLKKEKQEQTEEKRVRKRRKRDKSKKHKKHKQKKHRKQKFIDDEKLTKLPSTIWIEESGLEFEKAFHIHRKPDYDNRAFEGLYQLDIALHYLNPKLKCLGLTGKLELDFEQKSKQKQKKETAQRYWESLACDNEPLKLDQNTTRKSGFGFSNNYSYVPLELPGAGENIDTSAAENQNPISELLSKTRELNERVRENPNDIQAWLALADLQSQQMESGNQTIDSFNRTAVEKHKKCSKLAMEKKAAILAQAVEKNPSCVDLTVAYMNVCMETMNSEAILEKWKKILFTLPQKTLFWKHYLMFCQSSFSAFSFSATLASYTKCFTTLSAIQTGKFKSHSPDVDLEDGMVEIFVQFCQFLRQSGQTEKAVAAFQALIEFNCFCPKKLNEEHSVTSFFETFWDSDVPRFGEENARGWSSWMEDKPETSRDISLSEIFPCDSSKGKSLTQEEILRSHSEKSVTWLNLETSRDAAQWLPKKTSDVGEDDENEDPDRIVLSQDISCVLFKISDEKLKFQLICCFLSFLGNPIDVNYFTSSSVNLEGLLHILLEDENQLKSFEGLNHNFACGWSYFKRPATEKQQYPDISHRMFIRNVFNQSLESFSDKLQATLAIFWLTFEKSILVSEVKPNQRKQCYKAVRKLAKSLLKLEQHRNDLSLWFAFIEIEWINGNFEEARRVVFSLLEQLLKFSSTDEISIMRYYHFVRLYCELEMGLRNGSKSKEKSHSLEDDKNRILRTISVLLSNSSGCSVQTTLTPAQILKTHKALQEKSTEMLADFRSWGFEVENHEKREFLVDFMICYALFQYWSLGIDAAESILNSLLSCIGSERTHDENTKFSCSTYHKDILVFNCKLLLFHSRNNICPVKTLRDLLSSSLSFFPENVFFLHSFVMVELRSCVSTSIRRYFDGVLPQSKTPLPWLFAILYETQRQKIFQSVMSSPVFEANQKEVQSSTPSALTILPQTGVLHRLRSLYERAIHHPSARHCVAIWRSYMKFEVRNGDLRQAKAIFYQALQSCSWAKIMYLDAIEIFPELFEDIYDMLEEKELRIRTPLEELELLLET